jgi:CubicO group peptidase (beta-lactamase class C family)
MKKLKIILYCSLAAAMLWSCQNNNSENELRNDIINGLQPAAYTSDTAPTYNLREQMQYWDVPAVSLVVIDNMEIVFAEAFGVKKKGDSIPVNENTLFQAASVSKPVAAIGAMTLVHKGLLDLDTDINDLAEGWQIPYEDDELQISVRQILSHSAGLSVPGFAGYSSEDSLPDLMEIIEGKHLANSPAVRVIEQPGTKFMYSGGGYQVMQKIMEDITRKDFSEIMDENVFEPLNMSDSYYAPLEPEQKKNAAWGHLNDPIPNHGPIHVESAAGGLWTTPADLGYLIIDLMKAYTNQESEILDHESLQSIMKPVFWDYGYGFKVMGEGRNFRFSHGGATAGWHSHFMAFPERGQAVVVMTNGTNGWVLWPEIERAVANVFEWPVPVIKYVAPIELTENQIEEYTGNYAMNGLDISITSDTAGLSFEGAGIRWQLIPVQTDTLEIADMEGQVFFRRSEENEITGLHMWFGEPDWSPYRAWNFTKKSSD